MTTPVLSKPVRERINETLWRIRRYKGLTQLEVGKQIGCSAMGLSYLERGTRDIKLAQLEKWASVLGYKLNITLED